MTPHTVYLSPPEFFDVEYVINPWMDMNNKVDHQKAQVQWEQVVQTYQKLGVKVNIIPPLAGFPDLTFAGDAIFLMGNHALVSNFRFQERAGEAPHTAAWMEKQGFTLHHLPPAIHFEGNAEAISWNGHILCGYGIRSDVGAHTAIQKIFGQKTVPLEMVLPFYHLDIGICPLNDETLAYFPGAFSPASQEAIQKLPARLIKISKEEAIQLACNTKILDHAAVMSNHNCPQFAETLAQEGFQVIQLDTSEFVKSGGGVKCLTLEHYPG